MKKSIITLIFLGMSIVSFGQEKQQQETPKEHTTEIVAVKKSCCSEKAASKSCNKDAKSCDNKVAVSKNKSDSCCKEGDAKGAMEVKQTAVAEKKSCQKNTGSKSCCSKERAK